MQYCPYHKALFASLKGLPSSNMSPPNRARYLYFWLERTILHSYRMSYPEARQDKGMVGYILLFLPDAIFKCQEKRGMCIQGYELICPTTIYSNLSGSSDFIPPKWRTDKSESLWKFLMVQTLHEHHTKGCLFSHRLDDVQIIWELFAWHHSPHL